MVNRRSIESAGAGLGNIERPVLPGSDAIETRHIPHIRNMTDRWPANQPLQLVYRFVGSTALKIVGFSSTGCSADEEEELDWRVRLG